MPNKKRNLIPAKRKQGVRKLTKSARKEFDERVIAPLQTRGAYFKTITEARKSIRFVCDLADEMCGGYGPNSEQFRDEVKRIRAILNRTVFNARLI